MNKYGESGLHGAEARAHWREVRTHDIKTVAADRGLTCVQLTPYQYRVADLVDFYPTNGAWHNIKTGQRGYFHRIDNLDRTIRIALEQQNA